MGIIPYNITLEKPKPFWFEDTIDIERGEKFMQNYWHFSIYLSALYVTAIFYIRHYMKDRTEFQLHRPLFVWNLVLAILSVGGTLRMVPGILHVVLQYGFTFSVCNYDYITTIKPTTFWSTLFIGSKAFELGDTLFIVLRKRKLVFLHCYHHIMTIIMCWYTVGNFVAATHWFGVMNYAVHSFMYTYFMLSSVNIKVPRQFAMVITFLQITQMVVGSFACFWAIMSKYKGQPCDFSDNAVNFALCVYVSYVLLFCRLFYFSYVKKDKALKDKQT